MKKKNYVEGALGFPMLESQARELDRLLKSTPKEYKYTRKGYTADLEQVLEGERCDISKITSDALDRDNEVVIPKGIDRSLYQQNPIVCWNHDLATPAIGKCVWIKPSGNGLLAKTQYAKKPDDWEGSYFPELIFSLTKQQILRGKSIGFLPTEVDSPSSEEISKNPSWAHCRAVIRQCTLFEYSVCNIGCNQEALVQSVSKAFLAKFGITPAKAKKPSTSIEELALKALERINIDEIVNKILDQLTT